MSIIEIEAEALKLAPEDQAWLLHRLVTAVDGAEDSELTNEALEHRWKAFQAGQDKGVSSEEMHADARKRYGLA